MVSEKTSKAIGHNRPADFFCATYERETGDDLSFGITVCATLDEVKKSLDGESVDGMERRPRLMPTATGDESDLELDLSHFFAALQKYYELADIAEILGPVYLRTFFKARINKYVSDTYVEVEEHNGSKIYALDRESRDDLDRRVGKWADMQEGVDSLPSSILLGLVASFDSLFAQLFSELLLLRPERYNSSDRQITVSEILRLSSFEDVLHKVVSDEVDAITSKTHVDQIITFEKSFSVSVREKFTGWGDFVEIFERRNLAAHGDLCVDDKYIANCRKAGLSLKDVTSGNDLVVDEEYLSKSIDTLVDLGTRLVFAAWHKQAPSDRESAYKAVVNITYEFIRANRFKLADSVADYVLNEFSSTGQDAHIKTLTVNRAIAMKKLGLREESRAFLQATDWTAASPLYNLCVAGVVEDTDTAIRLLPVVFAMKEIGPTEVRTWPAFDWIRSNEDFALTFERVFDEQLAPPQAVESITTD